MVHLSAWRLLATQGPSDGCIRMLSLAEACAADMPLMTGLLFFRPGAVFLPSANKPPLQSEATVPRKVEPNGSMTNTLEAKQTNP
eukprot:5373626-Pleurochrysis_carterae.AAC.2